MVELQDRACHSIGMRGAVVRLKITLEDVEPLIWRRIDVTATTMLKTLHLIIQAAIGWENVYLFHYDVDGYSANGGHATLADLVASGVQCFSYVYGTDGGWEHKLRIEEIVPADSIADYPRFIDGAGRCPPQNLGNVLDFYAFLDAHADPRHSGHNHILAIHGAHFDPAAIDEDQIQTRLAKIAKRLRRKNLNPKRIV